MFCLLIMLCCFAVFVFSVRRWHRNARVNKWRVRLSLDKHQQIHNTLYASIDGFHLSQQARRHEDALEYVYGETDFESFIAVLALCQPNHETIFYDLGCGVGKLVIACAMVFEVRKSCGIECLSSLYDCAKERHLELFKKADYQKKANTIDFKINDLRDQSFRDATLIFINATAFFGDDWAGISLHIALQIKSGTLVISTSKPLAHPHFLILRVTEMKMSWGTVQAFIQKKQ